LLSFRLATNSFMGDVSFFGRYRNLTTSCAHLQEIQAARYKKDSPFYGMLILNTDQASTVMIIKHSFSAGFAGEGNELFYDEKTINTERRVIAAWRFLFLHPTFKKNIENDIYKC
jgi:hypothetical protein